MLFKKGFKSLYTVLKIYAYTHTYICRENKHFIKYYEPLKIRLSKTLKF